MSSAEVRRLWEEPTEEIGPTSDSVGIFVIDGGEDVNNAVRFEVQSAAATNPAGTLFNGNGQTFGNYTGLITNPRIMQFALRYEF